MADDKQQVSCMPTLLETDYLQEDCGNLQVGAQIQALDHSTGVWYGGVILEVRHEKKTVNVRFNGFPKKTSDGEVPQEYIRQPIMERPLDRKKIKEPRLKMERLLKDDIVFINGSEKSEVVLQNDPFKAEILTSGGRHCYEQLNLHSESKAPEDQTRKNVKKKRKRAAGATHMSSGDPAACLTTDDDIAETTGYTSSSPMKVKLTDVEKKKVMEKVSKWKEGQTKSETINVLNKIHTVLKDVHATMIEIKNDFGSKLSHTKATCTEDNSSTPLLTDDEAEADLFPSFTDKTSSVNQVNSSTTCTTSIDTTPPVTSACIDGPITSVSSLSYPLVTGTQISSEPVLPTYSNLSSQFKHTPSPMLQTSVSPSTSPFAYTCNSNQQIANSPSNDVSFGPLTNSNYSMSQVSFSGNSPHQIFPAASAIPAMPSMPALKTFSQQPIGTFQNNASQPIHVQSNSFVPQSTDDQFLNSDIIQEILHKSKSSRTAFVARLTNAIFSFQEIQGRNVNGLQNKNKLNEHKVRFIKNLTFAYFPSTCVPAETVWQRDCVKAIDRSNRQRLRFYKEQEFQN